MKKKDEIEVSFETPLGCGKFVPLGPSKVPNYTWKRSEVLSEAKKILKGFGYSRLGLEDSNKISFHSDDWTLREITYLKVDLERALCADVSTLWIDGDKKLGGFWMTICFDDMKLFRTGKKMSPRLEG